MGLLDFYQKVMSLFGSTYVYEQLFSLIRNVKSKINSRVTDAHFGRQQVSSTFETSLKVGV